jgi:pimeloyl-ACP methyl ester carboxylesterase
MINPFSPARRLLQFRFAIGMAALGIVSIFSGAADAAQTAASITYDFTARPAGLPAAYGADPGESLRFLSIKTIDGYAVQAALWQPAGKPVASTTIIVGSHGSGANYQENPQGFLAKGLALKGYAFLSIDNRAHDGAVNTENFYEIARDIDAAVYTARALGYKTLVLEGHSLGTVHMAFYAANNWAPDIKAALLLSPFSNLPWKSRNVLIQDDSSYAQLANESLAALRAGTAQNVLPDKMGYFTGEKVPVSGRHFLTYRDETTSTADTTYWIKRVPYPTLLVRDQADGVILPWEPYEILSAAHTPGALVPSIRYVIIPDKHPPSIDGHEYANSQQPLVDAVAAYLADALAPSR